MVTEADIGAVPVRVYVIPVPGAGEVTVMVPVATVQVGWINVAAGAAGVSGDADIVAAVADEVQPAPLVVIIA